METTVVFETRDGKLIGKDIGKSKVEIFCEMPAAVAAEVSEDGDDDVDADDGITVIGRRFIG